MASAPISLDSFGDVMVVEQQEEVINPTTKNPPSLKNPKEEEGPFDCFFSALRKTDGEEEEKEMGSVPTNTASNCFYSFDLNDPLFVFDWEEAEGETEEEAEAFGFDWEAEEEAGEVTEVDLSLRLRPGFDSPNGDLSVHMSTGFDRKEEKNYISLGNGEKDDGEEEAGEFGFDWEAKEGAEEETKVDLSLRLNYGFDSSNGDLSLQMKDYISLGNEEEDDGEGEEEMRYVHSKGPFDRFYSGIRKTGGEEVKMEMEMGSVPANSTSNCLYSVKSLKTEELHKVLTRALRNRVLEDDESES